MHDIEKEAMEMQLHDKLLEYKQQMGLLGEGSSTNKKQISSGSNEKGNDEEMLEQVLLNETNEQKGWRNWKIKNRIGETQAVRTASM